MQSRANVNRTVTSSHGYLKRENPNSGITLAIALDGRHISGSPFDVVVRKGAIPLRFSARFP
eukprot:1783904-Pyramimonas_sp.AAC.1